MPEMSEHLKQLIYARKQFREAEQRLQQKAFDAQYPPESINNTKFTAAQEQETYYRLQELLNPNYKRPILDTDSEEVQTKRRLEDLRESRAKAEAHLKAEEANYVPKAQRVKTPTPTKSAYGTKVAESDRLQHELNIKTRAENELKRAQATIGAKVNPHDLLQYQANVRQRAANELKRAEADELIRRNYEARKVAYNQKLAEAKAAQQANIADPAGRKPRFSLGNINPFTGKRTDLPRPPGKPYFSRGAYNPFTGKKWADPRPPTNPSGGGNDDVIQQVQRKITERFNAVKQGVAAKQAGGPTSKASSPSATAVLNKPGAEIPHMAVGAAATGVTLSSRAIGIASNGVALQSGIGAAVSFGLQVASGVDPVRAAFSSIGIGVGSSVGQVALTLLTLPFFGGVPGGIVGQIAGAYAGQALADSLYNTLFGKESKVAKSKSQIESAPFTGGQSAVDYVVTVSEFWFFGGGGGADLQTTIVSRGIARGPIAGIPNIGEEFAFGGNAFGTRGGVVTGKNRNNNSLSQDYYLDEILDVNPPYNKDSYQSTYNYKISGKITSVTRIDGQPDTGGNIGSSPAVYPKLAPGTSTPTQTFAASPTAPPSSTPLNSQTIARKQSQPQASPYAPPPAADLPLESNKRKPLQIQIPAGKSVTISSPDGVATTIPASDKPRILNIPRPLPSSEFGIAPAALPITLTSPNSEPIILSSPGSSPVTVSIPGSQPYTFNPTSDKNAPLPLSQIKPFSRNQPSTLNPIPGATPTTTPATTPTTTPSNPSSPATQGDLDDLLLPLGIVGGLAGLGFLIKQIHDRTTPESLETAAAAGTCKTTQPGGCSSNLANEAGDRNNQNLLDKLGLPAGQVADLLLLRVMNNKLGNQIPGGLAGGVGRLSNFLGIDRILNILNLMAVLHNGFMLSNQLKVTLLEVLSSIGNATGLLQSAEGDNVDLNATYNKGITSLIDSVIGEQERVRLELLFKRYNRIYQAGANLMNSIQSMTNSLGEVLETTAEYTGKIGNSLMGAGAIAGNAFRWMSEKHDAKSSKFLQYQTSIGGVTQALEVINEISENVVEGQEAKIEADKATAKFKADLAVAEKNPGIENKAVADEIKRQKDAATANTEGDDDTGLFSNLTD